MITCVMCNGKFNIDMYELQIAGVYLTISNMNLFSPFHSTFIINRSPVHPSVFATASSNGRLGFWNLASSLDEPITGQEGIAIEKVHDSLSSSPPTDRGINRLKWSADGRRIAVACADSVHVLGLAEELWQPNGDESAKLMNNLKGRGHLSED